MIALLVGTMGVIGCGDDSSSGNGNGGGVNPNAECNVGICAQDTNAGRTAKSVCIDEINDCIATGRGTTEQCIAFGVETCNA